MELPVKYMIIGTNPTKPSYIFELKVVPITTELQLVVNFYLLQTNLTQSLFNTVKANDSNKEYIEKLPKKSMYSNSFSLQQCEQMSYTLNNFVPNLSKYPQNQDIQCNIIPNCSILILPEQIYSLHVFLQQFILSYNLYKLNYFNSVNQQPKPVAVPVQQPIITQPTTVVISETVNTTDISSNISDQDIMINDTSLEENIFETGINNVFQMIKDNYIQFYLIKYINIYLKDNMIEEEFDIKIENETLFIQIEQFISNSLLTFSHKHYNDVISLLDHVSNSTEEVQSILSTCLDQIVLLSNLYIQNRQKHRKDVHILLKIYEYVFFIYGLKLQPKYRGEFVNRFPTKDMFVRLLTDMVNTLLNFGFNNSVKYKTLEYKKIYFIHPKKVNYENKDLADLKEIINNNKYILNLKDNELFITEVLKSLDKAEETTSKEISILYTNENLIKIDNLISDKINPNSFLSYSKIDVSKYKMIEDKIILTQEYLELLLLQLKEPSLDSNSLTKLVKNYGQLIIDDILTPISDNSKSLKHPISSVDLVTTYIRPKLNKNSSVTLEFEILYKVVIPFLYDNFDIREFIDCFH